MIIPLFERMEWEYRYTQSRNIYYPEIPYIIDGGPIA